MTRFLEGEPIGQLLGDASIDRGSGIGVKPDYMLHLELN